MPLNPLLAAAIVAVALTTPNTHAVAEPATVCGAAKTPCEVPLGKYLAVLPTKGERTTGHPAVVHLHGWSSSADAVVKNRKLVKAFTQRGYIVIAPYGKMSPSGRRDWAVRDGFERGRRDEVAFLRQITADAKRRFGVDANRILLTGFSRGGSMVWDIACMAPETFSAYAPVAGGFWNPLPERCAGPINLFHTHGWNDRTVPLEGRVLAGGRLTQGDIFAGLKILRRENECLKRQPDARNISGDRWTRDWTSCRAGTQISFLLHPGGHIVPPDWPDAAMTWFENILSNNSKTAEQH